MVHKPYVHTMVHVVESIKSEIGATSISAPDPDSPCGTHGVGLTTCGPQEQEARRGSGRLP